MSWYDQYDPNDPYSILDLGQAYNPSQGYPTKQVSDQVWDLIAPTPDYLIAQQFGAMTPWRDKFSTDAFFAADPLLQGPLAQALAESKGDTIGAFNQLQSDDMRKQLLGEIGRTEWDQIAAQGDLGMKGAITGEEKDQAALDYYMRGLEGLLAGGAPTTQRNMQQYDFIAERMGGRPYPGAGQGYPEFSGPGFGGGGAGMAGPASTAGGSDPLAALAGAGGELSPQGSAFGEGIAEIGMDEGPDRLDFSDKGRYAVVGGRRYELPETMAGPMGRNPAYQRALEQVLSEKRERMQGGSREEYFDRIRDRDKGRSGPSLRDPSLFERVTNGRAPDWLSAPWTR